MEGFSLIDNIENWIPVYTGMTKKTEIMDSRLHGNNKMEIFSTNFLNLLTKFKIMFSYLNKKKRILL